VRVITLGEHFWTSALRDANRVRSARLSGGELADAAPVSEADRAKIAHGNAERLPGL
jgi:hypothetical protein